MGFTVRLLDNAQHAQCCIHTSETKVRGIITDPVVSLICVRSQSKVAAASNFQSVEEYCTELCAWESALGGGGGSGANAVSAWQLLLRLRPLARAHMDQPGPFKVVLPGLNLIPP